MNPSPSTAIRIDTDILTHAAGRIRSLHIYDLKRKPFGRQGRDGIGRHMRPRRVCACCYSRVQVEQELIRETPDRGWLPESQTGTDSFLQVDVFSSYRLVC